MTDSTPEITYPRCGSRIWSGAVAVFYRRPMIEPYESRRGKRLIDRKFQCRGCSHEFTIAQEQDL